MLRLCAFMFLAAISLGFAQEEKADTTKNYRMGEVIVTGKKEPVTQAASVFDIEESQIEKLDAVSLTDAFRLAPGLYVRRDSRGEATVMMRGFDQRQISVLIDGVPVSDPLSGTLDISQLNVVPLDKITVSKGMPSFLYGINSIGGTINLVTNEVLEGVETKADMFYGMEEKGIMASNRGAYKNFFWSAGGNFNFSDGFDLPEEYEPHKNQDKGLRGNSGYDKLGIYLKGGYRDEDWGTVAISSIINKNSYDIPVSDFTSRQRYWRMPDWQKDLFNLAYINTFAGLINLKSNFYYETSKNTLEMYDDSTYTTQKNNTSGTSTYDDYSYGGNFIFNVISPLIQDIRFGVFYKYDAHNEQKNTGLPFDAYRAENYSLVVEKDYNIKNLILLSAGAGYDMVNPQRRSSLDTNTNKSAAKWHLGAAVLPYEFLKVYANTSFNTRFPTLKELYSMMGNSVPNPDLRPEKASNFEAGVSYTPSETFNLSFSGFYSNINDLIQVKYLPQNQKQYSNIGKADFKGFETGLGLHTKFGDLNVNYTYNYSENRTDSATSSLLEYRPRHLVNMMIGSEYEAGLSWQMEASAFLTQYGYNSEAKPAAWEELPDYTLVNIRIAQKFFKNYELYFRANNIGDVLYVTEIGYPQPGRSFVLGLKLDL